MKKYNKFTLLLLLMIGLVSCNKRLDIEPAQSISIEDALSSSEQIQNLLTGAYNLAGRIDLYGGRIQMMSDLYGFTGEATWGGTFQPPRQVFTKNIFVDNTFVRDHWLDAYTLINMSNLILDRLEIVDEDSRDAVSGGAKFLRALSYFDLVRMFSLPYEAGQQNSQLGVPLTLTGVLDYTSDGLAIARNSVEEVYTQVISDLNDAFDELPESDVIFADRYAAKALLARVYLQQGNYAAARDAADEVIRESGKGLMGTYRDAFNNGANSTEDLFAIQVRSQDDAPTRGNQLIIHYASEGNGGRGGDIRINDAFLEMFDSDTDTRSSFFYINPENGRRLTSKYTDQFGNISVIRLAEIYLIRAESNFNLNTAIGATPLEDVNAIRNRAGASPKTSLTLSDILLERQLELSFEGFLIHDLKRTGRPVGDLPYNANGLVYPIPQREMDANELLVQNPGYQ